MTAISQSIELKQFKKHLVILCGPSRKEDNTPVQMQIYYKLKSYPRVSSVKSQ